MSAEHKLEPALSDPRRPIDDKTTGPELWHDGYETTERAIDEDVFDDDASWALARDTAFGHVTYLPR